LAGDNGPRFSVARYGNVIGSRGSIVPFFRRLVAEDAKFIPITDPRMTRFWISLEQGVDFVLTSLEMMKRGEIFIPKIPSMSIPDVARVVAPGIPHQTVGIRPGEKLHEVMITEDDARNAIELPDRYVIRPTLFPQWSEGFHADEKPLPEGFRYSSDGNSEWLDADSMLALIEGS
jgi:UDP-N-acetylglucosamine 4,6-dehydratase